MNAQLKWHSRVPCVMLYFQLLRSTVPVLGKSQTYTVYHDYYTLLSNNICTKCISKTNLFQEENDQIEGRWNG